MDQYVVFATLLAALVLFISGRLRYDLVALLALLAVTMTGVVAPDEAFLGFGHPAIITVASVLVVSRGLLNAGVVDLITRALGRAGDGPVRQVAALVGIVTVSSAFMNNVGALALLLPAAVRMARKSGLSPSTLLMPLAFGSLLGGLTTLIGTPPNIIIASFRAEVNGTPFRMFDFTSVGLVIAISGGVFLALVGWRLIPQRQAGGPREELFQIEDYITEVRVSDDSLMVGRMLGDVKGVTDIDLVVIDLMRDEYRMPAPSPFEIIRPGDVLMIEADPDELTELIDVAKLELVGSGSQQMPNNAAFGVLEAIVTPGAPILYQTALSLNLRRRFAVNLLGVARQGARVKDRLSGIRFQAGDVLLLQGHTESLQQALPQLGCLPLAERAISLGKPRRLLFAMAIFAVAIGVAAVGLLPISVTMVGAAVAMLVVGILSLKEAYDSIDWPIIILLGALIPVGRALETSGGAQSIAHQLLEVGQNLPPVVTLIVVLVGTMFLSDLINNAAAAVLMAPVAIKVAQEMGVAVDPFLMAVAIGASCAFLTPIGHQSNTLVMGPGGYRFGDYWRVGLPLEVIIAVVGIPLILLVWPL